ncbi:TPA: hypothetical protein NGU10_003131 [Vibrio parahaemolyticus]|nr:hypothetical protein [Vibrio parahaemolyticus]
MLLFLLSHRFLLKTTSKNNDGVAFDIGCDPNPHKSLLVQAFSDVFAQPFVRDGYERKQTRTKNGVTRAQDFIFDIDFFAHGLRYASSTYR